MNLKKNVSFGSSTAGKLCGALVLFGLCLFCASCENPEESKNSIPDQNSIYDPNYDVLPLAGIKTERSRAELVGWKVEDVRDSVLNVYRLPRSAAEFTSQRTSGFWRKDSGASDDVMYLGSQFSLVSKENWQYKVWVPFDRDTVTFTQGNGPPEELALALKFPANEDVQVDYKINYSDWHPLIHGRDFGVLGLDSIRFPDLDKALFAAKNLQLAGVNLLIGGKNFLLEGNNVITLRISKSAKVLRERAFRIRYSMAGFSVYESDSLGKQVDSSRQLFNRRTAWNGSTNKTTYVFFGYGNAVEVKDIQVKRTFEEAARRAAISDSNLYLLPRFDDCSLPFDNGWCVTGLGKNTLLKIILRRDLFGAFTTKSESQRGIVVRGNIIVTPGFLPDNPPLLMEFPLYIDDVPLDFGGTPRKTGNRP